MSTPIPRTAAPPELSTPGLVLLFGQTPNGWKLTYALEALKQAGTLPDGYTVVPVYLQCREQFQDWFIELNPNSKMPVLIDNRRNKPRLVVFESGAILEYLARLYDKQYLYTFKDDDLYQEMINWIHVCQTSLGPNQGQLNHFSRYTQVKCDYSLERFRTEVVRIYKLYDDHLSSREFLVGNRFSYADMCTQPWFRTLFWASLNISQFPHVKRYTEMIESLPVVERALKVPEQDLVTRVKGTPGLEEEIMERMRKRREEEEEGNEQETSKKENDTQ
ncbi:hypothetical protein JCM16303_005252 [Sporobolomyces ruberrimus]